MKHPRSSGSESDSDAATWFLREKTGDADRFGWNGRGTSQTWWLWGNPWWEIGTDHGWPETHEFKAQKEPDPPSTYGTYIKNIALPRAFDTFYQFVFWAIWRFQVSLSLCFEVSSGLWRLLGCVNMGCPQIQRFVCFTIEIAKPATWVWKFTWNSDI